MHEQSQTVERDGQYYNVSGVTGADLPPQFDFERQSYDTLEAAESAARQRSAMFTESGEVRHDPADDLSGNYVARRQLENDAASGLAAVWMTLSSGKGAPSESAPPATTAPPSEAPGPSAAPTAAPAETTPQDYLSRAGLEGAGANFTTLPSQVTRALSPSAAFDAAFPADEYKGNIGVDMARGMARGVDAVWQALGLGGNVGLSGMNTAVQGAGDVLRILLAPMSDALRWGGLEEGKVRAWQKSLDLPAGMMLPGAGVVSSAKGAAREAAASEASVAAKSAANADMAAWRAAHPTEAGGTVTTQTGATVSAAFAKEAGVTGQPQSRMAAILDNEFGGAKIGPKVAPDPSQMAKLFRRGMQLGGAVWYHGFGDTLRRLYGEEADLVAGVVAATSPLRQAGSRTITGEFHQGSNLEIARKVWEAYKRGGIEEVERVTGPGLEIGVMKSTRENVLRALRRERLGGEDALKIQNFQCALLGDKNCIVLDSWMKKIFYPLDFAKNKTTGKMEFQGTFSPAQYRATEDLIRAFAQKMKVAPADVQAALWVAKKVQDEGKALGMLGSRPFRESLRDVLQNAGHDLSAFDEAGQIEIAKLFGIARILLGATAGGYVGETWDERIKNAMIGAGVGALASPTLVRELSRLGQEYGGMFLRNERGGIPLGPRGVPRPRFQEIAIPEGGAEAYAALDPSTLVIGNKGLKIDWEHLGSDQADIEDVLKKIVSMNAGSIEAARRGVIKDTEVQRLADLLGVTVEDVLKRPTGQALNAEQIQAVVDLLGANLRQLDLVNAQWRALEVGPAKTIAEQKLRAQLAVTERLVDQFYGVRAEAGRALRVFGTSAQDTGKVADILDLSKKGLITNLDRISDYLASLSAGPEQMSFLRQIINGAQAATYDIGRLMQSSWINAMLLTFQGNVANVLSNVSTTILAPWERYASGVVGSARFANDADRVFIGEGTAMIQGALSGFTEALILAGRALKTGQPMFGTAKVVPKSAEALASTGLVGRAVDTVGTIVELPSRFLMAADDFSKAINYRMELYAQAYREASRQGLEGDAFTSLVKKFIAEPPASVRKLAEEFANYQTFTKPLEGAMGSVQNALSHPLAKLVVPFFRTPMNIFTYSLERFPLIGAAVKHERADLMAGGARSDLAYGRWATGAMVMGTFGALALSGRITGRGPTDPNLNRDWQEGSGGYAPYSVKIGEKWYPYLWLAPIGPMLGFMADFATVNQELTDDLSASTAVAGLVAFNRTMMSQTFMAGLSKFTAATMGQRPQDINDRWFKDLAASMVGAIPIVGELVASSGMHQIRRAMDPVVRETFSVLDRIFEGIPGFSTGFKAKKNLFAQPIQMRPGVPEALGFLSPVKAGIQRDANDPKVQIFDEILAQRASIEPVPAVIFGSTPPRYGVLPPRAGIPLTRDQKDRLEDLEGREIVAGGRNLEQSLTALIHSPGYDKLADGPDGKGRALNDVVLKYREAARAQLMREYPELEQALIQLKYKRVNARVAAPPTNSVPQVVGR